MKVFSKSVKWIVVVLVIGAGGKEVVGFTQQPEPVTTKAPHSVLPVKVLLKNGTNRTFILDGVGCSASMCSRITIDSRERGNAQMNKIRLDSISAIRAVKDLNALFVFKNGDQRQLSVVPLNRVLYLINESGTNEKLDLAAIDAIEFLTPNSR